MILNENILNILENNNKNTFELISNLKSNTLKDDVLKKFDLVTLQELLKAKFEDILSKYPITIMAFDTHRWVETDGFYEVQFEIRLEKDLNEDKNNYIETQHSDDSINYFYLKTLCGDSNLEAEWTDQTPCYAEYHSFIWDLDTYDLVRNLSEIDKFLSQIKV